MPANLSILRNVLSATLNLLLCIAFSAQTQAQTDYQLDSNVFSDTVIEGPIIESPWSGSFASGLNGKSGNSENLDINSTLNLKRETDASTTTLQGSYFYASNDILTVTNRIFAQGRQERKFSNNPKLSIYGQAAYEWDEFRNFDYRLALHGGLGYEVYKFDNRSLKTRFGSGASREFGAPAPNDEWIPELQFGADWERKLSDRTKVFANIDYYPNVSEFADYRLNTNTGLNFLLDVERNINFRIFALNRYDSTPPPGNQPNDLDYGMALAVDF